MLTLPTMIVYSRLAAVVLASSSKAVVSGAIFVGVDTSDSSAKPVDIFKKTENHASAVSSVLVYSADKANFSPATQSAKSLVSSLDEFIQKASTFPGFVVERFEKSTISLNGSLIQFEQVIRESNPDYRHQALVARNLRDLIPGYIVNEDVEEWILNLIVIGKPEDTDTVKFGLVRVTLSIDSDKTGTAYIPKQTATLSTTVLKVITSYLASNADKLAELIPITSVRDALDLFASPKVEAEDNEDLTFAPTACHKKPVVFVNQGQRALYSWQNN